MDPKHQQSDPDSVAPPGEELVRWGLQVWEEVRRTMVLIRSAPPSPSLSNRTEFIWSSNNQIMLIQMLSFDGATYTTYTTYTTSPHRHGPGGGPQCPGSAGTLGVDSDEPRGHKGSERGGHCPERRRQLRARMGSCALYRNKTLAEAQRSEVRGPGSRVQVLLL